MSLSVSNAKESLEKLQHCLMGVTWLPVDEPDLALIMAHGHAKISMPLSSVR